MSVPMSPTFVCSSVANLSVFEHVHPFSHVIESHSNVRTQRKQSGCKQNHLFCNSRLESLGHSASNLVDCAERGQVSVKVSVNGTTMGSVKYELTRLSCILYFLFLFFKNSLLAEGIQ